MADLIERVDRLAAEDPDIRSVLQVLVGDRPTDSSILHRSARTVNDARRRVSIDEFLAGALRTVDVVAAIPGISTRQAVGQMHRSGRLLGWRAGRDTWFPAWQLGPHGLRDDLPRILDALRAYVGDDAIAADRVMTLARDELEGASIDEALSDPRTTADAWAVLDSLGGPR